MPRLLFPTGGRSDDRSLAAIQIEVDDIGGVESAIHKTLELPFLEPHLAGEHRNLSVVEVSPPRVGKFPNRVLIPLMVQVEVDVVP